MSPNNNKTKKGAETGISEFPAKTLMLQKTKAAKVPRKKSPGKGVTVMVLPPHYAQGRKMWLECHHPTNFSSTKHGLQKKTLLGGFEAH